MKRSFVTICFTNYFSASLQSGVFRGSFSAASAALVKHLPEGEAVGLGGLDFGGALAVVENIEHGFGFEAAHPDVDQESGETAHHFIEEAVALNFQKKS